MQASTYTPPSDDRTMLIIDDDREWTELLELYFEDRYRVLVVNSPADAIEVVRSERPSIILVDLVMPSIDGFGLRQRLSDGVHASVPTILVTGWKSAEIEECAARVGFAAVLSKPVHLDHLDREVALAIGQPATPSRYSMVLT